MTSAGKEFDFWEGPRDAKIVLVGEAWGQNEELLRRPFVGHAGKELFRMLSEAGFAPRSAPELLGWLRYEDAWTNHRKEFLEEASLGLTNVFSFRPQDNKIETLCGKKGDVGKDYTLPPFSQGKYFLPEYLDHLGRLRREIGAYPRNLVVCLGNTPSWAVLQATNISSIRGAVADGRLVPGTKCLATYHPAGVLRNWSWRPIVIADLMKALRQGEFPEIRRPERRVVVNPTYWQAIGALAGLEGVDILSSDTETASGQITCISFASRTDYAITIPFVRMEYDARGKTSPTWENYWTEEEEIRIWWACARVLASAKCVLGQNFIYDLQYLLPAGLAPFNFTEDTMLLHHALFPELQKGLGFMGSIYTDEASWKLMRRKRAGEGGEKRDE